MKASSALCLLLVLSSNGHGADLDPALAPLAADYRAQKGKLTETGTTDAKVVRDTYLVALDLGAKTAADAGDVNATVAINKEKVMATNGFPTNNPAEGFPKKLLGARKSFVKAMEKIADDQSKEVKKLNAAYLTTLTRLSGTATPALAAQILEEKHRMAGLGPVRDLQTDLAGTTWKSVNTGDVVVFSPHFFTGTLINGNLTYETPASDTLVLHWDGVVTLKLDPSGTLLTRDGKPDRKLIPPGSK